MKRIAIIGPGGAGKTRLAPALGQALDLPVVHLDLHYYSPGWQPLLSAQQLDRQRQLVAERWVMDGNYGEHARPSPPAGRYGRVPDLPPLLCVWRILRRWMIGHRHPAADLPWGLRPTVDRRFLAYVLTFRHHRRAALLDRLAAWDRGGRVIHLSSRRAVRRFRSGMLDVGDFRT